MYKLIARRKRALLIALSLAATLTAASLGALPGRVFSQTPPPEIFKTVSASQLGPGITIQSPGATTPAISQEEARREVPPELGTHVGEVRLVHFRDKDSVPTIDVLAWVFSLNEPPPFLGGPPTRNGTAKKATAVPPGTTFLLVVIDAQTGKFVTALGSTR